ASSFGNAAKAGGPNYLMQFARPKEVGLPPEKAPIGQEVNRLTQILQKYHLSTEELGLWYASTANYAYWAKRFAEDHDPSKVIGQDNILRYRPHKRVCFRIQDSDTPLDTLRVIAAAVSCGAKIELSWAQGHSHIAVRNHLKPHFGDWR